LVGCDDYVGLATALGVPGLEALFASIPLVPDVKECEVCGSPIDPHPLKRFCSNACRQKARYARMTQAEPVRWREAGDRVEGG
jgi:predicted nucleic acid-binding Zn ribbon protein